MSISDLLLRCSRAGRALLEADIRTVVVECAMRSGVVTAQNGPHPELSEAGSPYPNLEGLRPSPHRRERMDAISRRSSRRDLRARSR
jgi:hypothetical protein